MCPIIAGTAIIRPKLKNFRSKLTPKWVDLIAGSERGFNLENADNGELAFDALVRLMDRRDPLFRD